MKKIICLALVLVMALTIVACNDPKPTETTPAPTTSTTAKPPKPDVEDTTTKSEGVMTWEEYIAAELGSKVVIEAYVQGHQSWWNNKLTLYAQDGIGGYFLYDFPCSEELAAKLTPGTKIRVQGYKAEWAGEVEIVTDELDPDYAKIEIIEGSYVAEPANITDLLGTEELVKYQNMLVKFEGLTVVDIEYKNGEPGDDIYVTLAYNGTNYDFCVERYLTGPETDLYTLVGTLEAGDIVDVAGFAYWYNGINTHITNVEVKGNINDKSEGVMTWEEYIAAELGSKVVIEAYVQGHQSWWNNKLTLYAQDGIGGYFLYDFPCSEELAAKLTPGTKIRVQGYKAEWAGEVEIVTDELDPDYAKIEIIEGSYVAEPANITDLLGTEELVKYQNMLVKFEGLTVVDIEYKNGEPGDDIYVTLAYNGTNYDFCVERYLTGPETDLYTLVGTLEAGDVVDVVGFAYWYNGINTHITGVTVK